MRFGFTTRLIFGVTSLVSALAMALAARWSFQHGFPDYLASRSRALDRTPL